MNIKSESINIKTNGKEIKCTDELYSKNLLKIRNYPKKLYYAGNPELLNHKKIIAIVGSRDCTEYGRKYARIFAEKLSKKDICVISGMALGIDSAAHFGAIYNTGRTIAVLAGGINNIYPKENEWLYKAIIENGGCIITEHEDNIETQMNDFPKRNRIISGIADAVLVIEAKNKSGTKITARYAKEQKKKIYCIPSNLDSVNGVGANELLFEGAQIVISPEQIIKDCNNYIPIQEKLDIKTGKVTNEVSYEFEINIPKEYLKIYNLIKEKEINANDISRELNIKISELNSILTMMELEGYITQEAGNLFKCVKGDEYIINGK